MGKAVCMEIIDIDHSRDVEIQLNFSCLFAFFFSDIKAMKIINQSHAWEYLLYYQCYITLI